MIKQDKLVVTLRQEPFVTSGGTGKATGNAGKNARHFALHDHACCGLRESVKGLLQAEGSIKRIRKATADGACGSFNKLQWLLCVA